MKERIGYYDIARGLGIIFVVIGHIDTFYMPFRSVVITFHMALFFMISGMLFWENQAEERGYSESLKRKFLRIMVPYILFSILSILIEFVRLALQGVFYWPHFKALLISVFSLYGNSVMWFLPALFFAEMIFLAVLKMKNDFVTVVSILCLTILAVWANTLNPGGGEFRQSFYAAMIRGIFCTVFLCAGYYIRKWTSKLRIPGYVYGVVAVVLLGICVKLNDVNPKVDLRAMYWGEYIFATNSSTALLAVKVILYLVGAVSGALGIICLCKMFDMFCNNPVYKVLAFFGSNSLVIMATHLDWHVLHYSMDLASWLNGFLPGSAFYHLWIIVFVFAVEAVLIKLINKYVPILAGKYKK